MRAPLFRPSALRWMLVILAALAGATIGGLLRGWDTLLLPTILLGVLAASISASLLRAARTPTWLIVVVVLWCLSLPLLHDPLINFAIHAIQRVSDWSSPPAPGSRNARPWPWTPNATTFAVTTTLGVVTALLLWLATWSARVAVIVVLATLFAASFASLSTLSYTLQPQWVYSIKPALRPLAAGLWHGALCWSLINVCVENRRRRGMCARCGYKRDGLPPRSPCPECGAKAK